MAKKQTLRDVNAAYRVLAEGLALHAREPNIHAYQPHAKQIAFHKSEADLRLFLGGNRSGKTHGGVAEDIWWATGRHPYIKTPPPPTRGRVVTVNVVEGLLQILLPKFKQLLAPSDLINGSWEDSFHKTERILTLDNNSTIAFMTYEMDVEKFAGTSLHYTHYDEEAPKSIWGEAQARMVDTNGRSWMTMTPVNGMTWVFDEIYEPFLEGKLDDTFIVEVDMYENPYLNVDAIAKYLNTLDHDERLAREKGRFVQMSGKVFKSFSKETHVIPYVDPKTLIRAGWQIYFSLDHGWNNPTAALWHAVSPQDEVITFGEHYASEMTIAQHAQVIHAKEREWGIAGDIYMRTGDPAMKQTSAHTGTSVIQEYAKHDIFLGVENVPRQVEIGIARMQQYFFLPEEGGRPAWQICESCPNLANELGKLRWKTYSSKKMQYDSNKFEQVHKKDDHAFDSARYFATFLPELAPEALAPMPGAKPNVNRNYGEMLAEAIDAQQQVETGWTVVEDFTYTD